MGTTFQSLHSNPSPSLYLCKLAHGIQYRFSPFHQNPGFNPIFTHLPLLSRKFTTPAASTRAFLPRQLLFLRKPLCLTKASEVEPPPPDDGEGSINGKIVVASAITIALAVLNRVLYKLALVPMKEYPFFMAQVTTFGYVAIYFSILYLRKQAGIVTKEMLRLPKSNFMCIGALEALGVAAGMSAGAMLPGPAIPILSQTFLVWQLLFSCFILGRKYAFNQVLGCLLVATGVAVAIASGKNDGQLLSQMELLWPSLMIASSAFQAAASIIKEFVFIDAEMRLEGKPLDMFVVNSFGSGFQIFCVRVLLMHVQHLFAMPTHSLWLFLCSCCFLSYQT